MSQAEPQGWTVRTGGRDDFTAVVETVGEALLAPDERATSQARLSPLFEENGFDRLLVAVEADWPHRHRTTEDERVVGDGRVIGSVSSFPFQMTLPGGTRSVAGVTGVGVWPTHRRQGVLSALMRQQLADVHARGESLAVLWASEGSIYGRFGYAPATSEYTGRLATSHTGLRPDAPRDPALFVELTHASRARADLELVHAAVTARQVGRLRRSPAFWDRALRDLADDREGRSLLKAAVVHGMEGPVGYALYRTRNRWEDANPCSEVHVKELLAVTPAAWTTLFEHLASRDLVARLVFDGMAGDDPAHFLLVDPQRLVTTYDDSLWVRLVDVRTALAERSYAAPVDLVLEVTDRHAPWNEGRWRLSADASGAACETTRDAPDVSLDVARLGAVHLGGNTLTGFLRNGLLVEHTPGAVAAWDAALFRPESPFCDQGF
ncbi:GNAT family N-acetyltransferase [Nocardiopsis sp. NPDC006938]|uniref:GNAT family N-acetyltransferase n=1 Tax=Nocardiopsis sp. NPDC006938 TaxID=3364337 RepID=UPI0036BD1DF1